MKARWCLAVLCPALCWLIASPLTPSLAQSSLRIAVYDFQSGEGIEPGEASLLSEALRVELVNTGEFDVLEREQMEEILAEIGISLSECTDQECALRAGRFLVAEKVVIGTVGRIGETFAVSARLVDVETGRTDMATPVLKVDLKDKLLTVCVPQIARCQAFGECVEGAEDVLSLPDYGDLYIKTTPTEASVFIDGKPIAGLTPLFAERLPSGRRSVRLEKGDYTWSGIVSVRAGQSRTVEFTLERGVASLKIVSNPMEASVLLDGEPRGKTPLTIPDLGTGTHLVTIQQHGYLDHNEEVIITGYGATRVEVDLVQPAGLDVASEPASAEVRIDGELLGRTPCLLKKLRPGTRSLAISYPFAQEWNKRVEFRPGEIEHISAELTMKKGRLRLQSSPQAARATVDGVLRGVTPCVIEEVVFGRHHVQLDLDGYDSHQTTVLVQQKNSEIRAELTRQTGNVHFMGQPAGAAVVAGGEQIGVLPVESYTMPTGTYAYQVSQRGFIDASGDVAVAKGEVSLVRVALKPRTTGGAFWRSVVFPGWGQDYSNKNVRGTLFTLLQAGSVAGLALAHREYSSSIDDYDAAKAAYAAAVSEQQLATTWDRMTETYDKVDSSHSSRQAWIGAVLGIYALNLLDACIFFPYRGGYESAESAREPVLRADLEDGRMKVSFSRRF